jgi:hypothetical protein
VVPPEYAQVYSYFLAAAAASRRVWTLQCGGDTVLVTGGGVACLPLWPDLESAEYFAERNWPDLTPAELGLRKLLREVLPALASARAPAGIGMAPYPNAVLVAAETVRRDLQRAKRAAR